MISVVTFKWKKPGYRSTFTAEHVNTMRRMVDRCYPDPHRFICITDDSDGLDDGVEYVPLWTEHAELLNPTWPAVGPSCYRRLRTFSKEFEEIAGPRFVCIDLDAVLIDDMRPLWNRPEDFVIYQSFNGRYNGSMWMMTAGCRAHVWETFQGAESARLSNANGWTGSDQGWIQYCLKDEAVWSESDGIFAYRRDCLKKRGGRLPDGARLVVFHGQPDPWMPEAHARSPWISEYYR